MSVSSNKHSAKSHQNNQSFKKDIKQMVLQVMETGKQWGKHLHGNCCKCQKCNCGKHRCKPKTIKVSMQPTHSTYANDFIPKKDIKATCIKPFDFKCQHESVNKESTYQHDYPIKRAQSQPNADKKKKDNIQLGGPLFSRSTYRDDYQNTEPTQTQTLMKNLNNIQPLGIKLNAHSSYRVNFNWNKRMKIAKPGLIKRQNNLKINPQAIFRSQTSYGKDFSKRKLKGYDNNDSFAPHRKYQTIRSIKTQSSYKRDYISMNSTTCPAAYCSIDC